MMLHRINRLGLEYELSEHSSTQTMVVTGKKRLIVPVPLHEMSQRWYNWEHLGQKIQVAFSNLTVAQREFLLTGLTEAEWNAMFSAGDEA